MFQIEKILFPTDLSDATNSLAPIVKELTELFNAELHVVSVMAEPVPRDILLHDLIEISSFDEYQNHLRTGLEEKLKTFVEESFSGLEKKFVSLIQGDPSDAIVQYARDNEIDLIIMGTVTKPGLAGRIFGGTAHKVTGNASCAVMTMNPFKIKK